MDRSSRPGEFELIARYFAPLAARFPGAAGLKNDVAVLAVPPGYELAVKTDAIVAGVHFLPTDPPDTIARKALRVNLSDLAAAGSAPMAYQMALSLPPDWTEEWVAQYCAGLADDQKIYGVHLCGGDTTSTPGPLTISITAFGLVALGQAMGRGGARPGDDVWVTGTIGDAQLGLALLQSGLNPLSEEAGAFLVDRYRVPQPRLGLAHHLFHTARATIDISDGLVADLGHICATSGVGAVVEAGAVPLSVPARELVGRDPNLLTSLLTGGDDYEILFTASTDMRMAIDVLARQLGFRITCIGRIVAGGSVNVTRFGTRLGLERQGFRHF
jgi:thiamine-monophosphate kinase